MGLDLFRVMQGLDIQNETLTANANLLVGNGLPGGDTAEQDAAPIGSTYQRNDVEANNLQMYVKISTLNNSSADWQPMATQEYVDAVAQGLAWRAPVRVHDITLYANAAAFPTTGTIDGVALVAGDRVLFSNVTLATDSNVFIWDGAAWTEDTNAETNGDAVLVNEGTRKDEQWVYDGTNWVKFGSAAGVEELGFIRSYIGKTGPGAETPTYASTNSVTQSGTLESAIGELDGTLGTGAVTNSGGNFSVSDNLSWDALGTLTTTDAVNNINDAIGDRTYTQGNVVTSGETIATSIDTLDTAVGAIQSQTTSTTVLNVNAAAIVTIDTIPLADATEIKWMVQAKETATASNRRAEEIHAMNDGVSLVDMSRASVLTLGSAIAGFKLTVDILGTDMRLRLQATNNVDYVVKRLAYSAF